MFGAEISGAEANWKEKREFYRKSRSIAVSNNSANISRKSQDGTLTFMFDFFLSLEEANDHIKTDL